MDNRKGGTQVLLPRTKLTSVCYRIGMTAGLLDKRSPEAEFYGTDGVACALGYSNGCAVREGNQHGRR